MDFWQKFGLDKQTDQYQRECILDDSARQLIIARAGSGKTHTMVAKALYLVAECGVKPEEIEFLAFNRKAAGEINERLSAKIDGLKLADTFHALALRLSGISSNKVIENLENSEEADLDADDLVNYKQVFAAAAEKVDSLRGDYGVKSQGRLIYPNRLKYLIIDEYQDFSASYNQLIQAILKYNPRCKLICIGDDWQAINGFAGSEVKFFLNFKDYFPGAKILHMPVNYRCAKRIVDTASSFMETEYLRGKLEQKIDAARKNRAVIKVVTEKKISSIGKNGYLGQLGNILQKRLTRSRGTNYKVAVLSRCNKAYGLSLDYLRLQISNWLEQRGITADLDVSTIHKYKGKQADLVIVFPLVKKIIPIKGGEPDEEKRLFYVALTRAKDELYFLTDFNQNERSHYLNSLRKKCNFLTNLLRFVS